MRICRVGVEAVFDDVVINGRKLHRDELADLLVNDVKFVDVEGGDDFAFQFGILRKNPAVESGQFVVCKRVTGRIEIVEI